MNTTHSSKNTLILQVQLPDQLMSQIPERFVKSTEWKNQVSEILKNKISDAELVASMRRSVLSRKKESEESTESSHFIKVVIESEFRFDYLNQNTLKKHLSANIRSRIRLEDLLLACERCLKRRSPREVSQ